MDSWFDWTSALINAIHQSPLDGTLSHIMLRARGLCGGRGGKGSYGPYERPDVAGRASTRSTPQSGKKSIAVIVIKKDGSSLYSTDDDVMKHTRRNRRAPCLA